MIVSSNRMQRSDYFGNWSKLWQSSLTVHQKGNLATPWYGLELLLRVLYDQRPFKKGHCCSVIVCSNRTQRSDYFGNWSKLWQFSLKVHQNENLATPWHGLELLLKALCDQRPFKKGHCCSMIVCSNGTQGSDYFGKLVKTLAIFTQTP